MSGSRKKHVYIRIEKNRYVKARILLKGDDEANVNPTMDENRIIIVSKLLSRVPRGYKVVEFDDLPERIKEKINV